MYHNNYTEYLWHWRCIEWKNIEDKNVKQIIIELFGEEYGGYVNEISQYDKKKQDFIVKNKKFSKLTIREKENDRFYI